MTCRTQIRRSWPIAMLFAVLSLCAVNALGQETTKVPAAWLDAVETYKAMISETLKGTVHHREDIHQMVSKKGAAKKSDTTFSVVVRDLDGKKTVTETDRFGNPLDSKRQDSDDDNGKHMKFGPLDAFKQEHRGQYEFRLLEIHEDGTATIAYNPRNPKKFKGDGFRAEVTIDTSTGAPLKIVGAPFPLPRRMKEMEMKVVYEPLIDSVYVPSRARTKGMATFLLLKFRFQVEQRFTDYKRIAESEVK